MSAEPISKTQEALMNAAIRILCERPAASLSEIAEAAGVKRVTLHRQFGTREELLKSIAMHSITVMDDACRAAVADAKSAMDELRAIVEALVPLADRCHFLWHSPCVWDEAEVAEVLARHDAGLADLIDQAKSDGHIDPGIPNAWILASIDATIYAALTTSRAGDVAVNDAAMLAARTLFDGITTPAGRQKPRRRTPRKRR